ncbi:MAG: glycosyltransferase family 1 protein, partial [Flavobacterium sp.]|nr:glycosyltransferase family 1 protein [Flavobacterium sp.]
QDLLEAARGLDATVIVVGDGPYRKTLEEKFPGIRFVGTKKGAELIAYLSIADIFVNPSYAEGLPTSVLEAGSVGVACIATDVGGTREIITDTVNGYVIEPQDVAALRKYLYTLLNNETKRIKMGDLLQQKVLDRFNWHMLRKILFRVLK